MPVVHATREGPKVLRSRPPFRGPWPSAAVHPAERLHEALGNHAMVRGWASLNSSGPPAVPGRARGGAMRRTCACGGGSSCHCDREEEAMPRLQRKAGAGPATLPSTALTAAALRGQPSGLGLDPSTSAFMESRFGRGFEPVRIHTDAAARAGVSHGAIWSRSRTQQDL